MHATTNSLNLTYPRPSGVRPVPIKLYLPGCWSEGCDDTEYCSYSGTCKPLRQDNATCLRNYECESGKCSYFRGGIKQGSMPTCQPKCRTVIEKCGGFCASTSSSSVSGCAPHECHDPSDHSSGACATNWFPGVCGEECTKAATGKAGEVVLDCLLGPDPFKIACLAKKGVAEAAGQFAVTYYKNEIQSYANTIGCVGINLNQFIYAGADDEPEPLRALHPPHINDGKFYCSEEDEDGVLTKAQEKTQCKNLMLLARNFVTLYVEGKSAKSDVNPYAERLNTISLFIGFAAQLSELNPDNVQTTISEYLDPLVESSTKRIAFDKFLESAYEAC